MASINAAKLAILNVQLFMFVSFVTGWAKHPRSLNCICSPSPLNAEKKGKVDHLFVREGYRQADLALSGGLPSG
jgi:hypothetical protein